MLQHSMRYADVILMYTEDYKSIYLNGLTVICMTVMKMDLVAQKFPVKSSITGLEI